MDQVFRDLRFAFVYLDDILVASRNETEHRQHLREVLSRLRDNGMAINASKCVLGQSSVKYLGQEISAAGVRPLPSKLQSIIDVPRPTTKVELQRYLGMVNFYHRFLPGIAASFSSLHSGGNSKNREDEARLGRGRRVFLRAEQEEAFLSGSAGSPEAQGEAHTDEGRITHRHRRSPRAGGQETFGVFLPKVVHGATEVLRL